MRITFIGGRSGDEQRLECLAATSGFEVQAGCLSIPGPWTAEGLRGLVFDAEDEPAQAAIVLATLRTDSYFAGAASLLTLRSEQTREIEVFSAFDDFLVLPYDTAELFARLRALESRKRQLTSLEQAPKPTFIIDAAGHEVHLDRRSVQLTAREFALLSFLNSRAGQVVTRGELLEKIWGHTYSGGPRTVDVHVRRLRKKLGPTFPLETLRGSGYKLRDDDRRRAVIAHSLASAKCAS